MTRRQTLALIRSFIKSQSWKCGVYNMLKYRYFTPVKRSLVFLSVGVLVTVSILGSRSLLCRLSLFIGKQGCTMEHQIPISISASQLPLHDGRLPAGLTNVYDNVETFVMFIGHPRSGHSLVGAILDAHPEIIIPHEYNIFEHWGEYKTERCMKYGVQKYFLFYRLHELSTFQAMFSIRATTPVYEYGDYSYMYNIPGGWQGTYNGKLKVIGDKKGGTTSDELRKDPSKFEVLEEIRKAVDIPFKFIHVIRNPFDNIATEVLRLTGSRDEVKDGRTKINETGLLSSTIEDHFGRIEANDRVRKLYGDSVLDIFSRDVTLHSRETLQKMCKFLGVTCYEDYLRTVEKVIGSKPSKTRNTVVWKKEQIDWIEREMKKYSFLEYFSFESEY